MRLRRFELVIIGVTLAFACFIGGYFTGRSSGTVSIVPTVHYQPETSGPVIVSAPMAPMEPETQESDSLQAQGSEVVQPQASVPSVSSRDSEGRININTASRSELMDLPGIGGTLSERIVEYRRVNGPFSRIEDLRNVSGIGERRFETIIDRITVGS